MNIDLMKLNILPITNDSMDCYQSSIASVTSWWNRNFEMMFSESWDFSFNYDRYLETRSIAKSIGFGGGDDIKLLEYYHGIKASFETSENMYSLIDVIQNELNEGHPIAINVDAYDCPWDFGYQKYHKDHICMAVGIDRKTENLFCIDCSNQKINLNIPFSKISNFKYIKFRIVNDELQIYNWSDIIKKTTEKLLDGEKSKNPFYFMQRFADVIEKATDLSNDFHGIETSWQIPILDKLYQIGISRKRYGLFLEFFGEKYKINDLFTLRDELKYISGQWEVIISMLTKSYYKSHNTDLLYRTAIKIRMVAEAEEEAANWLRNICNNILLKTNNNYIYDNKIIKDNGINDKTNYKIDNIIFVDILNLFNNKGFGDDAENDVVSDLTCMGEFFIRQNLPDGDILVVDGMKFCINSLHNDSYDNISSSNQFINIHKDHYTHIMILGCSESGNYSERMKLQYENNLLMTVPLEFTDWQLQPFFNDIVAWSGKGAKRCNDEIKPLESDVKLFAQRYKVDSTRFLEGIHLPDCPNIHIFAISVIRM